MSFLTEFSNQISINDMTPMSEKMFADEIEWNWTGPQTGKGKKEELVEEFSMTWGSLVSSFMPGYDSANIAVDPDARIVSIGFDTTINVDVHGKVDPCYAYNPCSIQLHLNDANKVFYWQFLWDSTDPVMNDCLDKAFTFLESEL